MRRFRSWLRRWRCDHFDHPFRQVCEARDDRLLNLNVSDVYLIRDLRHCNYCDRDFEMPILHSNCRCAIVPLEITNDYP